ncbi:hypothetical protein GCM10009663_70520 [Kitasatospora arboriphila]|uniref:Uncharacterized protein n=1 Tax=Kitasatospora arboriphila TaxID=258052 RepID=A0ABP4ETY7_9ACTN
MGDVDVRAGAYGAGELGEDGALVVGAQQRRCGHPRTGGGGGEETLDGRPCSSGWRGCEVQLVDRDNGSGPSGVVAGGPYPVVGSFLGSLPRGRRAGGPRRHWWCGRRHVGAGRARLPGQAQQECGVGQYVAGRVQQASDADEVAR